MDHTITLLSNVRSSSSSNTIASFVTPLTQRLKLEGTWLVGFSEIQYTKSWYNFLKTNKIILEDELGRFYDTNSSYKELFISEGYYETEDHLIQAINAQFTKVVQPNTTMPSLEYNKLSKKVTIKPGYFYNKVSQKEVEIYPYFGDDIDYMIGIKNEIDDKTIYSLKSTNTNSDSSSLRMMKVSKRKAIEPFHPVEITRGYHSLYIYSNIVYPSYIGNAFSQIQRVVEVPTEKKFGEDIVIRYENPQYRKVYFNEISNIEIEIKDDSNELIPFKFGRVRIDLHFKKL